MAENQDMNNKTEVLETPDTKNDDVNDIHLEDISVKAEEKIDVVEKIDNEETLDVIVEKDISPLAVKPEVLKETEAPVKKEETNVKSKASSLENKVIESSGKKIKEMIAVNKDAIQSIFDEDSPLETVITRNSFYIDGYRMLRSIVVLESIIIGIMILVFVMLFTFLQPKDKFFATTPDGRLMPLVALSEPLLQKKSIISFAAEAATETMTFGFHDYRRRLQTARENFTEGGWKHFLQALDNASYIETIINNRQVISAIPLAPPLIVDEGLNNGVYKWMVEVPLSLSIESGSEVSSKKIVVKIVVSRRSRVENNRGVGIDQWITESYTGR